MTTAHTYIPIDRRIALANGTTLPTTMHGAVLFADMSGFTALTEVLANELGTKRGAEELTIHLNRVYDALIDELHRFGGSVIGFSGDAITCWLDGDDGRQAVACGLAMQAAMAQFAEVRTHGGRIVELAIKVAIAAGTVRRFVVGNPDYRLIDVLAGEPLEQMATAEAFAGRGDVVVHRSAVGEALQVRDWVAQDVARVVGIDGDVVATGWEEGEVLSAESANDWLLPQVVNRLTNQGGEFLAELRPACALFMRFAGIQYDNDPAAPDKLDQVIRAVQAILLRYDGSLLQLTIGDKGSYLYAAFGAPIAHEDDAVRATTAALKIRALAATFDFLDPVQIGLTRGRMRTGAYGSRTRRTYGVLGDNVNLAARLMAYADAGAILANERLRQATGSAFKWEILPEMHVKGKDRTVTPALLLGERAQGISAEYALPMVGRSAEFQAAITHLEKVQNGSGQLLAIVGEAGMGKSRLVAELQAAASEMQVLSGAASSFGTDNSYLVWETVWRSFFGLDGERDVTDQIATVTAVLDGLDSALVQRAPLLSAALGVTIPDNDLTASLDAKVRKSALASLLVACLQARAAQQPQLIVLEDFHWSDQLSRDLLLAIGRAIVNLPVLIVVVYRPMKTPIAVADLPNFNTITLSAFSADEAHQLIQRKLMQLFDDAEIGGAQLVHTITTRADGNPFYIEEILNYLADLQLDLNDRHALAAVDLPTSIYSLILSRLDQLTDQQQVTLRVASVIGRLFKATIIAGVYPELGQPEAIIASLDYLSGLDLVTLDSVEPELVYLFKYIITQQVAYESLLYATRARLHEAIGRFIEQNEADNLQAHYPLLAFHYEHSENDMKKRDYLTKAGEMAQAEYANSAAINYYQKALPLLTGAERVATLLKLGAVQEVVGEWESADATYEDALATVRELTDSAFQSQTHVAKGELLRKQGKYEQATEWYLLGEGLAESADDRAKALICRGTLNAQQGNYDTAQSLYEESLALRRQEDDKLNSAKVLNNMGIVARFQGEYERSRQYHQEALDLRRAAQNRWGIAASLNNLGNVTVDLGDLDAARVYLEEAVTFQREIGDQWYLANALNNLGNVVREQQDTPAALALYRESMGINRELDDRWALAYLLEDVGMLFASSEPERALTLAGAASTVREQIGSPLSAIEQEKLDAKLNSAREGLGESAETFWHQGQQLPLAAAIELVLS